jgi:hypothetical protein
VRVIFLGYADTMQEQALGLLAAKMRGAAVLDGEVADGLALFEAQEDFIADLMRQIIYGGVELEQDIPAGGELATASIADAAMAFAGGGNGAGGAIRKGGEGV